MGYSLPRRVGWLLSKPRNLPVSGLPGVRNQGCTLPHPNPHHHIHGIVKYLGPAATHLLLSEQTPGLRGDVGHCAPVSCFLRRAACPATTASTIPDPPSWTIPVGATPPTAPSRILVPTSQTTLVWC